MEQEFRRYYPAGEMLAHVVGFTGVDGKGQEGFELTREKMLAGKHGSRTVLKDRRGHIVEDLAVIEPPRDGQTRPWSIDKRIQYLAYRELKAAVQANNARSGSVVERTLFNHRLWVLLVCLVTTLFLSYQATRVELNASFEKMIPTQQPYIANYLQHQKQLSGLGNSLRIVVANRQGDIYDADYLKTLQALSDKLYLLPGVDRAYMKSLWTPATRWIGVTEEGFDGGPVIPDNYDGSADSLEQIRQNVERSGEVGRLVAARHPAGVDRQVHRACGRKGRQDRTVAAHVARGSRTE